MIQLVSCMSEDIQELKVSMKIVANSWKQAEKHKLAYNNKFDDLEL